MKKLCFHYFACLIIISPLHLYSQVSSSTNTDSVKELLILKLDSIINTTTQLKIDCVLSDTSIQNNIDTIINQLCEFRMAVRRKNKYVLQYNDNFTYYNDELGLLNTLTNADSIMALTEDLKEDMVLKNYHRVYSGAQLDPGAPLEDYGMLNLQVRVRSGSDRVLDGFEVFIKRGIFIPSRDSMRIPELTDNAFIPIAPGRFTIIVHNGKQSGQAQLNLTWKTIPVCDVKLN